MKMLLILAVSFASTAFAAPKSYQVTGPVLEVRPDVIVVQKGKEKWEIARESTQGMNLQVGDKVTIDYTMAVKTIEIKGAKPAAGAADTTKAKKKKKK